MRKKTSDVDLLETEDESEENIKPLTPEMYKDLIGYMKKHPPDAILPVQISYYTGLRI